MLSSRQQQCLQGIGVRSWRGRSAADKGPHAVAQVTAPIADTTAASATQPGDLEVSPSSLASLAPAPDQPAPAAAARQVYEIPLLDNWDAISAAIQQCNACELSQNCTQKVPGVGDREADLLIIGEGPGQDEDIRGEPFVGRSGQLLDRMLAAIGIAREQVYITNIVKCRPPNNRDPKASEAQQCRVYLDAQIKQIAPKVILSVGRVSAQTLLNSNLPVGKLIQQMHQLPGTEIPVKVTYHPAYLLRSPAAKAIAWQDLKLLHRMLQ
jgi:DNA polymerase